MMLRLLLLLCIAVPSWCKAQNIPIIPKAKLDSVANTPIVADSPMRFATSVVDFGEISEDEGPVTRKVSWRNMSDIPVVITDIRTGCSCTVVDYVRRAVAPGQEGEITVTFKPKGHPGPIIRKISVYAEPTGKRAAAVLTLKGRVSRSTRPTHDYPYAMGDLLLKRKEVTIEADKTTFERIEVMNAGDKPLILKADTRLLPSFISFASLPDTIAPASIADLEIGFYPEKVERHVPERIPLMLEGLPGPPSGRTITLLIRTSPQ